SAVGLNPACSRRRSCCKYPLKISGQAVNMTDNSSVILEKRGQAFWITINRPDKRNALNADVIAGVAKGYREAHDDKDVRVIVLTGAGDKAFCAGADLQNSGAAFSMDYSRPNVDYADLLRLAHNATN